jgi:hypothetical protein
MFATRVGCESNVWRARIPDKNQRIPNPQNIPVDKRRIVNKLPVISQVCAETGHKNTK